MTQIAHDTDGRIYFRRKLAEGKTRKEALRALKRQISNTVYRQLIADTRHCAHGPGRATGCVVAPPTNPLTQTGFDLALTRSCI